MNSSTVDHSLRDLSDLKELREAFQGELLSPGDGAFDKARRIWNGMIDRRPAVIARCRSASDVSAAVRYARGARLPLSVRCGGHNVAGTSVVEGGVLIDLSPMRRVRVDAENRIAEADGGCLLRDVDLATAEHGLACPAGVFSYTGLSGLALGGGYGWRARKWGLTCDHIVSAEVVLADGSVVEASADRHQDLLWALRGGGGNFGIVTKFRLRLRPVGSFLVRTGLYAGDDAAAALRVYRAFTETLSDDFHLLGGLRHAKPADPVPDGLRGRPVLEFLSVCSADEEKSRAEADALFAALPQAPVTEKVMTYLELQTMGDEGAPDGRRYYTKSGYVSELSDEAVDRLVAAAGANPSGTGSIDIEFLLGAIARGSTDDSAFPQRQAPFMVSAYGSWDDPELDGPGIAWARQTVADLREWECPGGYVNYISLEDNPAGAVETYGADIYARLVRVKQQYDPENLFRGTRAVAPAGNGNAT
ncbi:FAD-binding oxidoreductase [Amycolatopsis sp. VS8301801F10]|uniref:FAD-binding oxidoreductase n=1 Tax=Amycolatopsis sp. VS8301801F10 TaxID=2652442 RepID=UPI0038FC35A2